MAVPESKLFSDASGIMTEYVYYEDPAESPRIAGDDSGGLRYTRVYRTLGHDREHVLGFSRALLGIVEYKPGNESSGIVGTYRRTPPHRVLIHPKTQQWRRGVMTTGPIYAYATNISSVEFEGPREQKEVEDDGGDMHWPDTLYWPEADKAKFTVDYQALPFVVKEDEWVDDATVYGELDRYVSWRQQPTVQYAELQGGYLFFEQTAEEQAAEKYFAGTKAGGKNRTSVNTALGFPVPYYDVTYTWHRCLFPPKSADLLLGRTNLPNDIVDIDNDETTYNGLPWENHAPDECFDGRYPPGTLLYLSYSVRDYVSGAGQLLYDIEYKFRYHPYGVNYIYRFDRKVQEWTRVSSSGLPFTYLHELRSSPHTDDTENTRLPHRHGNFRDLFKPWLNRYPPASAAHWRTI